MTRVPPLFALVAAALLSAACSSGSAPAAGGASSAARDQAVKFSQCMRENGVGDFPDPNADGDFDYGISVSGEVWTAALEACRDLRPAGSFSADRDPQQKAEALRFAECMRENGVKDFPDPVDGEPLVDTNRIPSSNREGGMTVLNAAMHACGDRADRATGR